MPRPRPRLQFFPTIDDLTIPSLGSMTARGVLMVALDLLRQEVGTLGRGLALSPAMLEDMRQFHILRAELATKQRGALESFVARTPVGTLLRCLRNQPSETLLAEFVGLVYFELSRVGAIETPIRQQCPPKRLVSLGACLAITMPETPKSITYAPGKITVTSSSKTVDIDLEHFADKPSGTSEVLDGIRVEKPYYGIYDPPATSHNPVLALVDNNPLAMFEAHPDKQGNSIDLGGKSVEEWTRVLRDGLELIAKFLPDLRRELDMFVQQIVPVGYDEHKHLSASYQEAIGTIYMSLHPSLMTMTEALIHEFSHNKINALFEVDDVLENAFSPLYTSPVRPDPRPLHGVLLAVHAFLPVARLYEKMIEAKHPLADNPAFLARYEKIKQINAEGADVVLKNGRCTAIGKPLLAEIRKWDEYYRGVEPPPREEVFA